MNEEEQGELLWRHIVDVKYGGRADLDGRIAQAERTSSELREMAGLAEDLQRSLYEDPAYAQSVARSRLLEFIEAEQTQITRPEPSRRPAFLWPRPLRLGSRPAMVLLLIMLMATAVAAWTAIAFGRGSFSLVPGSPKYGAIDCETPAMPNSAKKKSQGAKAPPRAIPAATSVQ